MLTDNFHSLVKLLFINLLYVGHNDAGGGPHLIQIKLAEIADVHLCFGRVANGNVGIENEVFVINALYRLDNVGEFAHT